MLFKCMRLKVAVAENVQICADLTKDASRETVKLCKLDPCLQFETFPRSFRKKAMTHLTS